MFKKFLNKLKSWAMWKFLDKWGARLAEKFKLSSPKLFYAVGVVLGFLKFGPDGNPLTADLLSLEWILMQLKVAGETSAIVSEWLTWLLAFFAGTSTTAWLSSKEREKKIEAGKEITRSMN